MLRYLVKKIAYGFLVLLGVLTIVFSIFNLKPGDPAALSGGQNTTEDIIKNFNKEWGLDRSIIIRYFHFLNDVSPISLHNHSNQNSFFHYDEGKYDSFFTLECSENYLVAFKPPYLKKSYLNNRNVTSLISEKLLGTIILASFSIVIASIIGIFLGVVSAYRLDGFADKFSIIFSIAGMSAPSFFMASIISVIGGYYWSENIHFPLLPIIFLVIFIGFRYYKYRLNFYRFWKSYVKSGLKGLIVGLGVWLLLITFKSMFLIEQLDPLFFYFNLPGTGLDPSGSIIQINEINGGKEYNWSHLILPCLTLSLRPLAIVALLTKKSMEEVLSSDFIRTARAKGLSPVYIIWKHAIRNALNPVITAISGWFASLLAGAVFVEMIFNWDGIGSVLVSALKNDDLPVVMGITLVISIIFVLINLLVDVIYSLIDPRVVLK